MSRWILVYTVFRKRSICMVFVNCPKYFNYTKGVTYIRRTIFVFYVEEFLNKTFKSNRQIYYCQFYEKPMFTNEHSQIFDLMFATQ